MSDDWVASAIERARVPIEIDTSDINIGVDVLHVMPLDLNESNMLRSDPRLKHIANEDARNETWVALVTWYRIKKGTEKMGGKFVPFEMFAQLPTDVIAMIALKIGEAITGKKFNDFLG